MTPNPQLQPQCAPIAVFPSDSHLCDLCTELCKEILAGSSTDHHDLRPFSIRHYRKVEELRVSVKSRCHLCCLFWRGLRIPRLPRDPSVLAATYSLAWENGPEVGISQTLALSDGRRHESFLVGNHGKMPTHHKNLEQKCVPSLMTSSTRSESCFNLATSWLYECLEKHPGCSVDDDDSDKLPTRLLYVESTDDGLCVKLCITAELSNEASDEEIRYLTLSHCWGRQERLTLTSNSMESFKAMIPFDQLPRTMADALRITLKLGFQYLWIDSLCIVQDDDDDWRRESVEMGRIYRNGICNLAALGAHDDHEGCFVDRAPLGFFPLEVSSGESHFMFEPPSTFEPRISLGTLSADAIQYGIDASRSPLMNRAWVLQEVVLSPRTIYYGSELLFWECTEAAAAEIEAEMRYHRDKELYAIKGLFETFVDASSRKKDDVLSDLLSTWSVLLGNYTASELTYQTDKWLGIAGLALRVSRAAEVTCMAGLWKENLLDYLGWHVRRGVKSRGILQNSAPSWSWLHVDAPISVTHEAGGHELAIDLVSAPGNCPVTLTWDTIEATEKSLYPLCLRGRMSQIRITSASAVSTNLNFHKSTLYSDVLPWPTLDPWALLYSHDTPVTTAYFLLLVPLDDFGLLWQRIGTMWVEMAETNVYNELSRHTAGTMLDDFGSVARFCIV